MLRSVLVIEDDRDIAQLVKIHIEELNCRVKLVHDGLAGLAEAESGAYQLIILDLMLPGIDGLEITRRLRAKARYTPLLMLTAKSSELERVLGLEMGADDYLTKPFSVRELAARVKAIFRRIDQSADGAAEAASEVLDSGPLRVDSKCRTVAVDGKGVELTAKEFDLLQFFARNPGRVYSREQLLDQVWGYTHSGYEHTVNSHINRLRAKIERDPGNPQLIQTVWGVATNSTRRRRANDDRAPSNRDACQRVSAGRLNEKQVPAFGRVSTAISPSCSSTIRLVMASPRPAPPEFALRLLSTR
jgi:DNA-binding response OmpR family regulator